jgi:hypothetical protein
VVIGPVPVFGLYLQATDSCPLLSLPRTFVISIDAEPKIAAWPEALTERDSPVLIGIRDETGLGKLGEISPGSIDKWNEIVDIMAQEPDEDDDLAFKEREKALEVAGPLSPCPI